MNNTLKKMEKTSDELWLSIPKGGRTLGVSDDVFFREAGLKATGKIPRRDDYKFISTPEIATTQTFNPVRAFDMKPQMSLALLSQNKINCAIVGRDVMKEFNLSSRGKTGMMQAVELLDIGLSSCALTIAIPQDDPAKTPFDLNGRVIVTKYPNIVAGWARAKGIEFSKIINGINVSGDITGGIEGYTMFDPSVTVIADIVQSGESLVRYGWKPLGIIEDDWTAIIQDVEANVPKNERRTFINLNDDDLKKMAGVMMLSNVVLVRNTKKLSPAQEDTLNNLTQRFEKAAKALGASPIQQTKAVADQNLRNPEQGRQALPWTQSPPSTAISHGLIFL